jgi:hypothetical protein
MADNKPHVHIPEVLPPESEHEPPRGRSTRPGPPPTAGRKILAGLVIDVLDLILRGPLGVRLGLPVGFIVGLVLARWLGLRPGRSLLLAAVTGIYCMAPMTGRLPLGTVVATLMSIPLPTPRR